ncbi:MULTISPECIES: sigma-70 family RNA polymerase sigma factor [unclassified Rhizobium]|uniref:sigma-70 family RNA polymerase sigma factor n=1 Tax=unclassified Rhizobium TaxID=2613769 RepID=UPI00104C4595|nr:MULTISPECIES: sigma-70 family RNA polymerase sigma factor [unclassified Rhizobium]TCM58538.1 RNA polymerase sigma-70 factor (ECF subfamily) [Rhizobium sp. PP-F2F-G48]
MPSLDIAGLIAKVAMGDRAALASLYSAVSPKLFAICLRILKDRTDAEDALQDVFVKIWQRADRYAATGVNPNGWLAAIARNQAIDMIRARRPSADTIGEEGLEIADSSPDPEAVSIGLGEGRRIDRCMGELPPERADAVRNAYVEGLSYQELAERYNVPLNTMRTWLRRSLLKLKECLER